MGLAEKQVKMQAQASSLLSKLAPVAFAVLALLIIAVVLSVFAQKTFPNSPLPQASDFEPSLKDSAVYAALASSGFENSVVESKEGEVLVLVKLSPGEDEKSAAFTALGAAGALAPAGSVVKVQVEGERKVLYTARADDVQALLEGKITDEEFESRVESKSL